jgi:hypothetical protein
MDSPRCSTDKIFALHQKVGHSQHQQNFPPSRIQSRICVIVWYVSELILGLDDGSKFYIEEWRLLGSYAVLLL